MALPAEASIEPPMKSDADAWHDRQVTDMINDLIHDVNAKASDANKGHPDYFTYAPLTIGEKLGMLHLHAMNARETGDTTNTVDRDVEYYFWGRWQVADNQYTAGKIATAAAGVPIGPAYMLLKAGINGYTWAKNAVTGSNDAPTALQSVKGRPNAPPGGVFWFYTGIADGLADHGQATHVDVRPYVPIHAPGDRSRFDHHP